MINYVILLDIFQYKPLLKYIVNYIYYYYDQSYTVYYYTKSDNIKRCEVPLRSFLKCEEDWNSDCVKEMDDMLN